MGSNPISPILVFDTPPLQALHRVQLFGALAGAFAELLVPRAVAEETARARVSAGDARVPDLAALPAIRVVEIEPALVAASGAEPAGERRGTPQLRWHARKVDAPELEAVLLAKVRGATLVIEDDNGSRCAADEGVATTTTARLLRALHGRGVLPDVRERAAAILASGYRHLELEWVARGVQFD